MTRSLSWIRTLRAIVVTGLLVLALIGAVLGAIGSQGHHLLWTWLSPSDEAEPTATPARSPNGTAYFIYPADWTGQR